eukprot:12570935-Ditylum_brightwellii.AAC.1
MDIQRLPDHVYEIATLPVSKNGLGVFDARANAFALFVVPMARAICYATIRIDLGHKCVKLSTYLQSLY